ncbi:CD209 antigen-like protein E [Centropristis striata]|uniref:CD209 antigen-like protein E n=1 Tax=Centropristis striata TaxID=184440 RepID=UPI0027E1ADE5|nr:CD209 antigen-like protein E [Centropristis striata]
MISSDDSTDGKPSHCNTESNGSMYTVKVGSRSLPLYPLVIVCLGLLNTILMLTAIVIGVYCGKVSEESSPYHLTSQALIAEVRQLQLMQAEVIKAQEEARQALQRELRNHQQLKRQLQENKTLSDSIQLQLEKLTVEKATLQADSSDIWESCGRCQSGWRLFNTSCYFHSISGPNPLKNWSDSREDCIRRGADLAVIDNLEEQINLFEYLPKQVPSIPSWGIRREGIWIGLTDIQTEGNWTWINNVTLQNERYWIQGEPINHGEEDCAALLNMKKPRATWFYANCQEKKEWLCEIEPN